MSVYMVSEQALNSKECLNSEILKSCLVVKSVLSPEGVVHINWQCLSFLEKKNGY